MIEFTGVISGNAEKYFWARARRLGLKIILVSELLVLAPIIFYMIIKSNWLTASVAVIGGCIIPLFVFIPKSKKEKMLLLPKRIYTDGESIVCVGENYSESKLIGDETLVRDFGDFYELVYPFGKVSDKFICQKNLLSQGSLEDFEALFEGKIVIM